MVLGDPQVIRLLLRHENPKVLCLIETNLSSVEFVRIRWKFGFHNGIGVDSMDRKRGPTLLWKEGVNLEVKSYDKLHIDALIRYEDDREVWHFLGFYEEPMVGERWRAWERLR